MGLDVLGLIAGCGRFPLDVARTARNRGRSVVAIAFHGQTDPSIEAAATNVTWLHLGQVDHAVRSLLAAGVKDAVMAGKIPKLTMFDARQKLELDEHATRLIGSLPDRKDDSILRLVADHLESQGIRLLGQAELVPELVAGAGPLGATQPTASVAADIEFGWPIAKAVAGLDIGQTVVVRDRAVLAVEAIDGTDAAIERAGKLAARACVVKVAKPHQDPRFDLPAIGLRTIEALLAARASALAIEAGSTVVLDRKELVELADANEIALIGIESVADTGSTP
ncbi:MAG: UDP-2,3-diacylglucosamine diphosphatase LpxI [Myxococcota bacterium]